MTDTCTPLPDHGTLSRYHRHGCRCETCRKAARDHRRITSRLTAYGQWQPLVDAEPVRQHLRNLADFGIGSHRAARLAGVSTGAVQRLLWPPSGTAPSKRIRPATAAALLAVRPILANLAPGATVHPAGTRRRLQALSACGFPAVRLAAHLRLSSSHLSMLMRPGYTGRVAAATARAVAALYDQWWNADPHACGVSKHGATYARTVAAKQGWPPPAAWDDDTIDDPAATPDLGDAGRRQHALAEDAAFIAETTGVTDPDLIAERLGISRNYYDKIRERAGLAERSAA